MGRRSAAVLAVAQAWLLARGDDVVPTPGTRSPARIEENVAAAAVTLGDGDLRRIDEMLPHGAAGARYPEVMLPRW